MRILVDGFNLALDRGTGVATYARNLTYNLKSLGHEVHVLYGMRPAPDRTDLMREIAFFDDRVGQSSRLMRRVERTVELVANAGSLTAYEIPLKGVVIDRQVSSRLPKFDRLWNAPNLFALAERYFRLTKRKTAVRMGDVPHIAHWTYPIPVRASGAKNIYTLHDLVPLRLPFTTLDDKRLYHRLVKDIADTADQIVTVSECSKRDIVQILGVDESRVSNTYQAVEIPRAYAETSTDMVAAELRGAFRLEYKNYLLFYGAIEPKKNVGRIIEAYLSSGLAMPLVIAGARAWKSDQELRLLSDDTIRSTVVVGAETITKRRVRELDYVTFPQLVNLIRGAAAVVFPSLYEGFGLPIVESMLCGTPVVTSNLGSMSEVAGDAAILVDPYDTREIKNAMVALASDEALRKEMSGRGRARAELFSAERYQNRLSTLYQTVMNR